MQKSGQGHFWTSPATRFQVLAGTDLSELATGLNRHDLARLRSSSTPLLASPSRTRSMSPRRVPPATGAVSEDTWLQTEIKEAPEDTQSFWPRGWLELALCSSRRARHRTSSGLNPFLSEKDASGLRAPELLAGLAETERQPRGWSFCSQKFQVFLFHVRSLRMPCFNNMLHCSHPLLGGLLA